MQEYLILALVCCGAAVLIILMRNTRALRRFFVSGVGGLAALGAVNLTGLATGVSLAVNGWTMGAAVLLGLPGVCGMLFLKFVLGA